MLSKVKTKSDLNDNLPVGSAREVFNTFLKLGLTSFGGPIAHLGYFRKELIEKQHWLSESQFSQLLAICQFLPGPASSQLGFALGLLRAGWLGALAAFLAFTLPSALLLVGFASILPLFSGTIGTAVIHGLKLVAFAVVADAVWGMSKRLCPDMIRRMIAILATITLLLMSSAWSQILVVMAGAVAGMIYCRVPVAENKVPVHVRYGKKLGVILLSIFLILLAVALLVPNQSGLYVIGQAFYRAGALVFGGGHVVLPLLQDSVVTTGLVSNERFLAGYGAAQAIPGPMFAFSAYLGAIMPSPEHISFVGATVAMLFMFLPGFLLVSAVLPMWQNISHNPTAIKAISGINAAVVGLLAAALYNPILISGVTNVVDLIVGLIALSLLTIWRLSPLLVVVWCVMTSVFITMLSS
jgi:chromate transporter